MKKVKVLSVALSGIICASFVAPVVAQSYSPYSYGNSYQQPQQNQQYSQSNYGKNYGYTPNNQGYKSYQNYLPPLQGRVVSVPAGTFVQGAVAANEINTGYLTVGDTVALNLASDFYYNGVVILPAGSTITGNAVIADKAGLTGKPARLKIKFNSAVTPSGQRIAFSGKLATQDNTGILKGGTTAGRVGEAAKRAAIGSAAGALIGTFMGPLSGGKVGKGAVYGTAVGGGLGLVSSVANRGNEVVIPSGSNVDIVLDQPLSVGSESKYDY